MGNRLTVVIVLGALGCGTRTGAPDEAESCRPEPIAAPLFVDPSCTFGGADCGACVVWRAAEVACNGACMLTPVPIACVAAAVEYHEASCVLHLPSGRRFVSPSMIASVGARAWPFRACDAPRDLPACTAAADAGAGAVDASVRDATSLDADARTDASDDTASLADSPDTSGRGEYPRSDGLRCDDAPAGPVPPCPRGACNEVTGMCCNGRLGSDGLCRCGTGPGCLVTEHCCGQPGTATYACEVRPCGG